MLALPLPWILARALALLITLYSAQSVARAVDVRHPGTVFLIIMENRSWRDIQGNPSAPYINRTLIPIAARADNYFTPPHNHPSLPNYLWLEAGTNFGVRADLTPAQVHESTKNHLTTLLVRAGISWKAYEQGISGRQCPVTNDGMYAVRHDPMMYFDDVTGKNNPRSSYCIAHVRPYAQLFKDLRANHAARYNFITPDVCHDMHDTCGPLDDQVRQGDSWLSQTIPHIMASRAYRNGGVIFITWDEGTGDSDGPIGLLALSPDAKRGYVSHVRYTHSSTLRTIEEIFGLKKMLGGAAHSTDLHALFTRFP